MERKIYYNGYFVTLEKERPVGNYLIVENEIIKEVGIGMPKCGIDPKNYDSAVDLEGRLVVPGFIDSHLHMLTGALTKLQIDLNEKTFDSIRSMLEYMKEENATSEGWIRAFGFSEYNLHESELPTRADIDEVFPDRPVVITRVCGHLSIINSKALELFEQRDIENISGGEFKKNNQGEYSGIITENAQPFVFDRIPTPSENEIFEKLEAEQKYLISKGVTSVHDAGTDQLPTSKYLDLYLKFNKAEKLLLRTYLMLRPEATECFENLLDTTRKLMANHNPENSKLFFGTIKIFADGSLGGRTAALKKGYLNNPQNKGLLLLDNLEKYIGRTNDAGLKIAIHAIGDRACDSCLNIIKENVHKVDNQIMHRLEHAELLDSEIIDKIKSQKVFIAAQPEFIYEFGETYREVIGERSNQIQPLRTLLEEGVIIGFGTDYPIIDIDPLKGILAAIHRSVKGSEEPLNMQESLEIMTAIRAYTLGSAAGSSTECFQGSLKEGKFADFVVLKTEGDLADYIVPGCTEDALNIYFSDCEFFEKTEVLATVIGGRILYQKIT